MLIENFDTTIQEGPQPFRPDSNIIYEPKGPALEYAPLALNVYKACSHGCFYCYNRGRKSQEQMTAFESGGDPKKDFIRKLKHKAKNLHGDPREILLSFISDPYQHAEEDLKLTRGALKILRENDLSFTVLTKGGSRAARDFDILQDYSKARFGTTLIFMNQNLSDHWEPHAATIQDRIKALEDAKARGIKNWISLEPVIDPEEALKVIEALHPMVDHFKIGKLNHFKMTEEVDWISFREEAKALLEKLEKDFYLKKSLTEL